MKENRHNYAKYNYLLISDMVDIAHTFDSDWVFRGQSDSSWTIQSSLEREVGKYYTENSSTHCDIQKGFEENALKISKSSTGCINAVDKPKDDFSWLALLQHHGCKTRLVDFSESFYIALFFAVKENHDKDGAVWAIKTEKIRYKTLIVNNHKHSAEEFARLLVNNSAEWKNRYENCEDLMMTCAKPEQLNQRLMAQQGLFLCPLNFNKSFMENLTYSLNLSGNKEEVKPLNSIADLEEEVKNGDVIKITISQEDKKNILAHLHKMNLTEATLFPGLDGFARSLNYFAFEYQG